MMTKDTNISLVIGSPSSPAALNSEACLSSKTSDSTPPTLESTWNLDRSEGFHSDQCLTSDESVRALSIGLLSVYENDLIKVQKSLSELTNTQKILLETVQQENVRFNEIRNQYILDEIFNKTKQYQSKLIQIKKDMSILHDKASKLKKRSLRLQEYKQKEALQRELQKEKQAERERQILAKVPTPVMEKAENGFVSY